MLTIPMLFDTISIQLCSGSGIGANFELPVEQALKSKLLKTIAFLLYKNVVSRFYAKNWTPKPMKNLLAVQFY